MGRVEGIHPGALDAARIAELQAWATEVQAWPAGSHRYGQYAEETAGGPVACRTENVSACHPGVRDLVDGALAAIAATALGSAAVAFKDKLNYKAPGGAGFSPHQDLRAYPGATRVTSLLVAIDPCTVESGCLWTATGVTELLATDANGVLSAEVTRGLGWQPVELAPGDAVCLDGLTPHFSEANRTDRYRRVLVASYAPARQGYDRKRYYTARESALSRTSAADGRYRISTIADFEGIEAAPAVMAETVCTHAVSGDGPTGAA